MTETLTANDYRNIIKMVAKVVKRYEAYEEECEEYAKQGYRPHYCIHGANLWVDYDVICGYCEDGDNYMDIQRIRRDCIDEYKADKAEMLRRLDWFMTEQSKVNNFSGELFSQLLDYVKEPMERYK